MRLDLGTSEKGGTLHTGTVLDDDVRANDYVGADTTANANLS